MDQQRSIIERVIRFLIPYYWVFILAIFLVSFLSFPRAIHLMSTISTELSKLLPDSYPTVKLANEIKGKFKKKGGGDLAMVFDSPDPKVNLKVLEGLISYLDAMPEVGELRYTKQGYDFFDKHKLLFIELDDLETIRDRIKRKIQHEKLRGLYIDFESEETKDPFTFKDLVEKYREDYTHKVKTPYISSEDETMFVIWIYPGSKDSSLSYYKKFYNLISSRMADFPLKSYGPSINIGYAGAIKTRINEYNSLIHDLKVAGVVSFAGIFILLVAWFRRIMGVILIFVPLVCGMLIGFAVCSFFIGNLNIVTSFLFSILFGLGVDVGIHMFSRYVEDRSSGMPYSDAMVNVLLRAGRSSSVGVITTCATFFILIINDFKGFSEFGWIAGTGLVITLLVYLTLFPSLLVAAEKLKLLRFKKERVGMLEQLFGKFKSFPQYKKVAVLGVALLLVSTVGLPFVGFEWNYRILRTHLPKTEATKEKLKTIIGRINSPAAVVINGKPDADALKKEFAVRMKEDTVSPTVDYFNSSYDLVPPDQKEKMDVLKEIDVLLADDALNVLKGDDKKMVVEFREAIAKTGYIGQKDVPKDLRNAFFGLGEHSGEEVAYVMPLPKLELDDGRKAIAFYDDVHKVTAGGKTFFFTSDSLIFADVLKTMFKDSRKTIVLSLVTLALLVWFDFRDIKKTAVVMGVLCSGIFWMCGLMVILGLKFNFYNMITIPMIIGMGEDNSVHLIHRFEEYKQTSVMRALFTSGSAAMVASLTTMLGYSGLIFAHHPGLNSIGVLAIIGMGTCMIASLVFLPAILQIYINRQQSFR